MLARADGTGAPLVLDARAGELGLAGRPREARGLDGFVGAAKTRGRRRAIGFDTRRFDPDVVGLDVELRERFGDPVACGRGVLQRVTQRRRRVDGRKHFAAGRFDVGFESFDLAMRHFPASDSNRQRFGRAIALGVGGRRPVAAVREGHTRRLAPGIDDLELRPDDRRPRLERLDLFAVERDLLLLPVDGELARVRRFARGGRSRLGLDELDPQASEIGLDLGQSSSRRRLALARLPEAGAGRFNVSASWRYFRAKSTFSQRRSSSRSF